MVRDFAKASEPGDWRQATQTGTGRENAAAKEEDKRLQQPKKPNRSQHVGNPINYIKALAESNMSPVG